MSLDNFIPELWAAEVMRSLEKSLIFGQAGVVNRDYEGEIKQKGDTVRINEIGPVTVKKYTKNTAIDHPEVLNDAQQVLEITEQDYFNFMIDDIDAAQQSPKVMQAAMAESSYGLRDAVDKFIAGLHPGASAANLIGSTAAPVEPNNTAGDASNIYKLIVQCRKKLVEANVPTGGWWMIVPPWYYAILLNEDKFISVEKAGTSAGLRNGQVGSILGFTIMESNNVAYIPEGDGTNDVYKIMFGNSRAITYANQINKVEPFRPEDYFSDAVKGLNTYGAKVVRPQCLGVISCYTD